MQNNRKLFVSEKALIDFFKKSSKNTDGNEAQNKIYLIALVKHLSDGSQFTGKISAYIDINSWLASKLQNKPLLQLFIEEYKFQVEGIDSHE